MKRFPVLFPPVGVFRCSPHTSSFPGRKQPQGKVLDKIVGKSESIALPYLCQGESVWPTKQLAEPLSDKMVALGFIQLLRGA